MWMIFEQHVPQELISVTVQALTDDVHPSRRGILPMLGAASVVAHELSHDPVDNGSVTAWKRAAIR